MEKRQSKVEWLKGYCKRANLHFYMYSPGDGITRYKFSQDADSDYFACHSLYVALGYKEANVFATGFVEGWYASVEATQ